MALRNDVMADEGWFAKAWTPIDNSIASLEILKLYFVSFLCKRGSVGGY